jgi:C-terminal processing protease CtpA/Prc
MKKWTLAIAIAALFAAAPAQSMTLVGGCEKTDVEGRIGVRISMTGRISKVRKGSPAEAAGLRRDDYVILVDGKKHAAREICGEPGTVVQLEVKRGFRRFQVAVQRTDFRTISYN